MKRAIALVASLLTATASADSVSIQNHTPGSSLKYTLTENAISEAFGVNRPVRYSLIANYNYTDDPLVETDPLRTERTDVLVGGLQTLDLMAGIEWNRTVSLNAAIPLHSVQPVGTGSQFALGDARVFAKIFLSRDSKAVNFALVPELRFPTGDQDLYVSDSSLGLGMMLAAEKDFGSFAIAGNIGYRRAENATFRDIDYRQRIPMTLGISLPIGDRWSASGEAHRQVVMPLNRYQNPSEFYAGLVHSLTPEVLATGGLGLGTLGNVSSADFRVLFGLKMTMAPEQEKVVDTVRTAAAAPVVKKPLAVFTPKEIQVLEEVKFEEDKDVLTPQGRMVLDDVAKVIKDNTKNYRQIGIEGHCNTNGSDAYNMNLSMRRAITVKEYLVAKGISPDDLNMAWYGERRPKPESLQVSKEAALIMNRRVQFRVIK